MRWRPVKLVGGSIILAGKIGRGGFAFAAVSLAVGLGEVAAGQEIIFAASMAIVLFLIRQLTRELPAEARNVLVGTALVIFVFRAMPGVAAGFPRADPIGGLFITATAIGLVLPLLAIGFGKATRFRSA